MKAWLFSPFTYIAGRKSLFIGLFFLTATLIIAYYSGTHFDGAIDAHVGLRTSLKVYIAETLIAWGSVVLTFYAAAFILSSSRFRFIDIAGTAAIARAPMLLAALIAFAPALQNARPDRVDNAILAIGFLMLIPVIWMIALMYNAFTICLNLKGSKAVIGFIGSLLAAEVLSIILNQTLKQFLFNSLA